MNRLMIPLLLLGAVLCAPLSASAANISIDTVRVGDPGNPNDPLTGNLYGGVAYGYRIGTTEVTTAQYVAFLNAKAASDPLGLYGTGMDSKYGAIVRSGVSGSYTYAPTTNMADKPANLVSWYNALRFINWLNNGQGDGDTETGAYTLLGGTPIPSNGPFITRNPGATWFLPSESEWYKSAYYQPTASGGDSDGYWLYATASNDAPTRAKATVSGDIANPGANVANYGQTAQWPNAGGNGWPTTVGSAGPLSASYYGTFDQTGNISEMTEGIIFGSSKVAKGGSFFDIDLFWVGSTGKAIATPATGDIFIGFRVAAVIPEPSTGVMAGIGCCLLGLLRRRFKRAS